MSKTRTNWRGNCRISNPSWQAFGRGWKRQREERESWRNRFNHCAGFNKKIGNSILITLGYCRKLKSQLGTWGSWSLRSWHSMKRTNRTTQWSWRESCWRLRGKEMQWWWRKCNCWRTTAGLSQSTWCISKNMPLWRNNLKRMHWEEEATIVK